MPQLDISTYFSQIFWLAVCFGILCVFMATFIAPRIGLNLHYRAKVLEDYMLATQKLLEEAEGLRQKSIQQLHQARHDASQQLQQVVHELTSQRHERLRDFDAEYQLKLKELSGKFTHQKQEILDNSQDLITHLVENMFQRITNTPVPGNNVTNALKAVKKGDNHD